MESSSVSYDVIRELVLARSGIVLSAGKDYLIESRMRPLIKAGEAESLGELVDRLRKNPRDSIVEKVVDALTTNETSFYRDSSPFDCMREKLIPEILERNAKTRTLRLWCAASSSGQEPYSVAIMLRESFPQLASWKIEFIATDISESMLERCRNAEYSQLEITRGLPAQLLTKYFEKHGLKWRIKESIRSMVDFERVNLISDPPPMPVADLVLMRNVLIYFGDETKQKIIDKVSRLLRPDGFLMLGSAETVWRDDFERETYSGWGYYRRTNK